MDYTGLEPKHARIIDSYSTTSVELNHDVFALTKDNIITYDINDGHYYMYSYYDGNKKTRLNSLSQIGEPLSIRAFDQDVDEGIQTFVIHDTKNVTHSVNRLGRLKTTNSFNNDTFSSFEMTSTRALMTQDSPQGGGGGKLLISSAILCLCAVSKQPAVLLLFIALFFIFLKIKIYERRHSGRLLDLVSQRELTPRVFYYSDPAERHALLQSGDTNQVEMGKVYGDYWGLAKDVIYKPVTRLGGGFNVRENLLGAKRLFRGNHLLEDFSFMSVKDFGYTLLKFLDFGYGSALFDSNGSSIMSYQKACPKIVLSSDYSVYAVCRKEGKMFHVKIDLL